MYRQSRSISWTDSWFKQLSAIFCLKFLNQIVSGILSILTSLFVLLEQLVGFFFTVNIDQRLSLLHFVWGGHRCFLFGSLKVWQMVCFKKLKVAFRILRLARICQNLTFFHKKDCEM